MATVSLMMKKCDYCGRANDDTATACNECGSSGFAEGGESVLVTESRKLKADEVPPVIMAQKEGSVITLKCRTPGEAYLVCDELEKADILAILPDEEELLVQFRRDGCVEVRVSAKAYKSLADLRSTVEFQYKRVRAEQPLPQFGKLIGIGCGMVILPGLLVFAFLLTSYQKNGYARMAKDFKFWFFLGVVAWLLLAASIALSSAKEGANHSTKPTRARHSGYYEFTARLARAPNPGRNPFRTS